MSEERRYACRECGAAIFPTGRMGAPCPGCGRGGTGRLVTEERKEVTVAEAGRRGGNICKERHGRQHYVEIGKAGGASCKEQYGPDYYSEIGRKGGETTAQRHGPEFYTAIGKKGGKRVKELIAKALEAEGQ